ncbi:MAG: hypothetical protein KDB35_14315, partial [Acidimicrobiales bacterium]|nr:hypothetical protein [Acidimicrobiales bacterium]
MKHHLQQQITELIADVLSLSPAAVSELAEVIARKTDGNPFFTNLFLLHLCEQGLLRRESTGWTWDMAALATASLPRDALELMTRKLERLEPEPR